MEKITIYKNKGEIFRCSLKIDGAETKDTVIRLCLEFRDHPNYFFYGELKSDGECTIEIPRLKNLDEKEGRLTVEAIADSVYFKVYEAEVQFRNSVEVSMESPTVKKAPPTQVKMEGLEQGEAAPKPEPGSGWERPEWKPKTYQVHPDPVTTPPEPRTFPRFRDHARKREG